MIIPIGWHHNREFRLEEHVARSSDFVPDAEAELWRSLVQRAETQAQARGLEQVG
jgi:hypothetical protein